MNKQALLIKIILSIFCVVILHGKTDKVIKLEKLRNSKTAYFNLTEFMNQHSMRSNYYEVKDKIEIIYKKRTRKPNR